MRKKILTCLLAVCMVCSICACGSDGTQTSGSNSGSETNNSETIAENKTESNANAESTSGAESGASTENSTSTENNSGTEENSDGVKRDADGVIILSAEEMKQYLEKIEITTENWNKYIEEREETRTATDAFGEVSETKDKVMGIKNEYAECCVVHGLALKFDSLKVYGEVTKNVDGYYVYYADKICYYDINGTLLHESNMYNPDNKFLPLNGVSSKRVSIDMSFTYADSECITAAGEIVFVKIPDNVWTSVNNGEDFAVKWETADGNTVTLRQSELINDYTSDDCYGKINKLFE